MADGIEMVGTVLGAHRGDLYEVECVVGGAPRRVLARRSGRLYRHHIVILAGDLVTVELSPYDLSRGRIVYRGRKTNSEAA